MHGNPATSPAAQLLAERCVWPLYPELVPDLAA
jgi:hypothetical protein